jgi:Zn-dependent protease with chaperone function
MNHSKIRISTEREITAELRTLFSADMVEKILQEASVKESSPNLSSWLEGRALRISEQLVPDLHSICRGVCDALEFEDAIEFFVVSDPTVNAVVMESDQEDSPHAVLLNSAAVSSLSSEELAFVIGHELGHLICGAIGLEKVIAHIYPDEESTPLPVRLRLSQWRKLEELSADRYGLLACGSFAVAQSVMIKLSSGLDLQKYGFDPNAYQQEIDRILAVIEESPATNVGNSHPEHPLRVKALSYFGESTLYAQFHTKHTPLDDDPALEQNIQRICNLLVTYETSPLDMALRNLIASGSLLIGLADGTVSEAELQLTIDTLARFTALPSNFLHELAQVDDLQAVFIDAVETILTIDPARRYGILEHLSWVATSDQRLVEAEVDALYLIGTSLLGLSRKEVAQVLSTSLQQTFAPKLPVTPSED